MNNGDTVSVQCTIAGGDLPLEVHWTLNGRPLEPYLEIATQKMGKRINSLIIDSVSAKHAGNYTCVAENQAGIAHHSSELVVIGMNNRKCLNSVFVSIPVSLNFIDKTGIGFNKSLFLALTYIYIYLLFSSAQNLTIFVRR